MEQPLVETRAHTAALARPIALAAGAALFLALVVAVLARTGRPGLLGQAAALVAAVAAGVALLRLVRRVWDWDRTLLVVTADELVVRRAGLRRSDAIVPLRAISRLRVRRTLAGRMLGYGTLELAGPGRGSRLRFVPRPDEVSAVISAYAGRHDVVS